MLHTAVRDFNITEYAKKLVLIGMEEAEIPYLMALMFDQASREKNHVWYEQPRWSLSGLLAGPLNNTDTTGISITPALARILKENQVIQINGEQLIVKSVDRNANTFEVTMRGHAGTVIAAHGANDLVDIVGTADPEGVVTDRYEKTERVEYKNHFQEMTENIKLSKRAIADSHKDRNQLLGEEREARMITHLEKINKAARVGSGVYDATQGQHTMKGYEQLIIDANGITQASLNYTSGGFGLTDWENMQLELAKRNSKVTHIHTNAVTKKFLIDLVGASYQKNDNNQGTMKNTMGVHFDSIILEHLGKVVYFIIDESIVGYQANLIDLSRHTIVPKKYMDGTTHMFKISPESENSKIINETLESRLSLEVQHAERQVVLKNLK